VGKTSRMAMNLSDYCHLRATTGEFEKGEKIQKINRKGSVGV